MRPEDIHYNYTYLEENPLKPVLTDCPTKTPIIEWFSISFVALHITKSLQKVNLLKKFNHKATFFAKIMPIKTCGDEKAREWKPGDESLKDEVSQSRTRIR